MVGTSLPLKKSLRVLYYKSKLPLIQESRPHILLLQVKIHHIRTSTYLFINIHIIPPHNTCRLEQWTHISLVIVNLLFLLSLYTETTGFKLSSREKVTVSFEWIPNLAIVCLLVSSQDEDYLTVGEGFSQNDVALVHWMIF